MNLAQKAARARRLDTKIAQLKKLLAEYESELIEAAKAKDVPKSPTDCGGWSAEIADSSGQIARITYPADKLKSIDASTDAWKQITETLRPLHLVLFNKKTVWTPVEGIRDALHSQGAIKRRAILKLITGKSSPTVTYETKEAA